MNTSDDRQEQFLRYLLAEYNHPFSGWDFSYLDGRMESGATLPWDYVVSVRSAFAHATSLLDMGTGGGELLSSLAPLPAEVHATEAYPPNIPLARQRLAPLGITVHDVEDESRLPLADEQLDLVIDRHTGYDASEVRRILRPGGTFITQQVGGRNCFELNMALAGAGENDSVPWDLPHAVAELEEAGLHILEQQEFFPVARFYDIGAVTYYLKVIPWQLPGFTVERYLTPLQQLNDRIQRDGSFIMHEHCFFLRAQKP